MEDDEPLSDDRAFALAKSTMRTAALCGVIAGAFAWFNGLRWYWIVAVAIAVYLMAAFTMAFGLAWLAKRRRKAAIHKREYAKLSPEAWKRVLTEFKRLQEEEKK